MRPKDKIPKVRKQVTLKVTEAEKIQMEEAARRERRTFAGFVKNAISCYLNPKEIDSRQAYNYFKSE